MTVGTYSERNKCDLKFHNFFFRYRSNTSSSTQDDIELAKKPTKENSVPNVNERSPSLLKLTGKSTLLEDFEAGKVSKTSIFFIMNYGGGYNTKH